MREIKFRGKRIDNGEWMFGDLSTKNSLNTTLIYPEGWLDVEVDPSTVGQYTGLEDKNGTEIYEGDIIRHHDDILSEVFYNTAHCAYLLQDISGNRNKCQCDRLGSYCSLWIEVIANIHDNPELLGGAK